MKSRAASPIVLMALITLLAVAPTSTHARIANESGPGNGTDYVKILFAEAQYEVLRALGPVADNELVNLGLASDIQDWLLEPVAGGSRFELLKSYVRKMELGYQYDPCSDGSGKPASICFFRTRDGEPYVMISVNENKMTTREQAAAMLIHEAGHFTGEPDHLFLDRVGVELMDALKLPRLLMADSISTEIVANPFLAKDACDQGTSTQAEVLMREALADLKVQCAARRISCDLSKTEFVFRGTNHFEPGIGFTMKVTCQVKALLGLH